MMTFISLLGVSCTAYKADGYIGLECIGLSYIFINCFLTGLAGKPSATDTTAIGNVPSYESTFQRLQHNPLKQTPKLIDAVKIPAS
jgi:hypothetical protein